MNNLLFRVQSSLPRRVRFPKSHIPPLINQVSCSLPSSFYSAMPCYTLTLSTSRYTFRDTRAQWGEVLPCYRALVPVCTSNSIEGRRIMRGKDDDSSRVSSFSTPEGEREGGGREWVGESTRPQIFACLRKDSNALIYIEVIWRCGQETSLALFIDKMKKRNLEFFNLAFT